MVTDEETAEQRWIYTIRWCQRNFPFPRWPIFLLRSNIPIDVRRRKISLIRTPESTSSARLEEHSFAQTGDYQLVEELEHVSNPRLSSINRLSLCVFKQLSTFILLILSLFRNYT